VVAWQSFGQDGSGYGIYAQRYNAGGTTVGTEFQVNTETSSSQSNPAIAVDADGDFVVAWQSFLQDGSSNGVYAQRYNAGGTAFGTEFQVNTETLSNQGNPAIALDADGDFVVAWNSYGQDGDEYGVYAQRFVGPENVDLALTVLDTPDPVEVGQTLTYTLMLDNLHAPSGTTGVMAIDSAIGSATGVTGTAELTGLDFTFQSATTTSDIGITCTPAAGPPVSVTCALNGPLPADTSLNADIQVIPNEAGTLTATANVTGNQFDSNEPTPMPISDDNGVENFSIAVTESNNNDSEETTVDEAPSDPPPPETDPAPAPASGGSGGGGCALGDGPGTIDPSLPLFGLLAGLALYRRRLLGWLQRG